MSERTSKEEPTINKAAKLQPPNDERRPFLPARRAPRLRPTSSKGQGSGWSGVGVGSWWLVKPRSVYASRLASAGPCVERWSGAESVAAAGACDFQSPVRRDRDWPRREGYPQPGQWQHDVAIPYRKRRYGAHPRSV